MAPWLHSPDVLSLNRLWRKMISSVVQSKAVPDHSVARPSMTVQLYVSTSPGQAHLTFDGGENSFSAETKIRII